MNNSCPAGYIMSSSGVCELDVNNNVSRFGGPRGPGGGRRFGRRRRPGRAPGRQRFYDGGSIRRTPMRSTPMRSGRTNAINAIPPEPPRPQVMGTRDWAQYGGYTPPLYPWEIDPDYFSNNGSRLPCVEQCSQFMNQYCQSGYNWGPYCDCNCCGLSMFPSMAGANFYCDCGQCSWQHWLCVSLCIAALVGASLGGRNGRAGAYGQPRNNRINRNRKGGKIRRRR